MSTRNLLRSTAFLAAATGLALSATAAASASRAPGGPACSTGVGCQFPSQQGWALSDDNPNGGLLALDNLKVTADGAISSLCWWGMYFDFDAFADCGPGSGDDFTITYFNDDACNGVPGSVRAGPLHVSLSAKFATGNVASGSGITMAEYQYEAAHAPVAVTAGECLWIEILNHTTQECFWLWSTAGTGDGRSALGGLFGYMQQPFDLAYCVDVATTSDGCASSAVGATYCTAKVNSAGCTPGISGSFQGIDLFIQAEQVLPGQLGLLFYGVQGPDGVPFQGGYLCVSLPLRRTAVQNSSSSGSPPCTGTYSFDFTSHVESGVDPALVGGQQVWAQYWSRDMGSPSGTGLTDALSFSVCP